MLAIIVIAVVGIGRVFSGGSDTAGTPVDTGSPKTALSADPIDEDSVISPKPPPQPSTSPGTAQPAAVAYAFAGAWVDHRNVSAKTWRDRLVPNATKDLADDLTGTDPADVPANRVNGQPKLVPVGENLLDAVIETDSGVLTLRLVAPEGRWLVSAIDWDRP